MKTSNHTARRRGKRAAAARGDQLLAAYDRSGLCAATFTRQQGLNYTTFCGRRQRRAKAKPPPGFGEVEVLSPAVPAELVIELSAPVRMRLTSAGQIELAARLLQIPTLRPHAEFPRAFEGVRCHLALRFADEFQWPVGGGQ